MPEILAPDNLKTSDQSPRRYEPDINPTYHDLAQYYRTAVIQARLRRPKDKEEVGVQVVRRWILARLRNRKFFNLADLNSSIHELLEKLNN